MTHRTDDRGGHALSLSLSLVAIPGAAQSCDANWDCNLVFDGDTSDVAVGAVIRAWGPEDEVFVAYERRFPTQTDDPHELYVNKYRCSGSDCSSPTLVVSESMVGQEVLFDQGVVPTMNVYEPSSSSSRYLNFVVRDRADRLAPNCGSATVDYVDASPNDTQATNLDLRHWYWTPNLQAAWDLAVSTSSCIDRNAPYARTVQSGSADGYIRACWRVANSPDQIECGTQTGPNGAYTVSTLSNAPPGGGGAVRQEHVALDLDSGDRIAVHRSREQNHWRIRVRFVDDATDPDVVLFEGTSTDITEGPDYPDFHISGNGKYFVAWHEKLNSADDKIWTGRCNPNTSDCTDEANWDVDEAFAEDGLRHVHVTTDGNRLFMVYMEDDGSGAWRVRYRTKCWSDASWSASETPHEPANSGWDQSLFLGRMATAADRGDNVFHAAFVDMDNVFNGFNGDGDAYWVSRTYTDCP